MIEPIVTKVNERKGTVVAEPRPMSRWSRWKLLARFVYWHRVPTVLRYPLEYVYDHVVHGRRPVKTGTLDETAGGLFEEGIDVVFSGACPVQGEGTVDGREVYYRSRGIGWEFSVAPEGSDDALGPGCWEYAEAPYHWPDGGWVHADVSRACIRRAVAQWRAEGRP